MATRTETYTEMVWNSATQSWEQQTRTRTVTIPDDDATPTIPAATTPSTPASTSPSSPSGYTPSATTPYTGGDDQPQTNPQGESFQEAADLAYNILQGELVLRACVGVLKVKRDTTVRISGIGKYLSGLYYVSEVNYTLDAQDGFSMSVKVIKVGFGDNLKSSEPDFTDEYLLYESGREESSKTSSNKATNGKVYIGERMYYLQDS